MTAKHTTGPWRVAGRSNGAGELLILRGDGKEIGCIRGKAHLADAPLIAAAPDLADEAESAERRAIEGLVQLESGDLEGVRLSFECIRNEARAALIKAGL